MDQNVAVDGWPTFEVNKRTKKGARIIRVNDSDMQKCPSHLGHWAFFYFNKSSRNHPSKWANIFLTYAARMLTSRSLGIPPIIYICLHSPNNDPIHQVEYTTQIHTVL